MGAFFVAVSVLALFALLFAMPLRGGKCVTAQRMQFIGRLALLAGVAWKVANYLETGLLAYSNLAIAGGVALVYGAQLVHEFQRKGREE